MDRIARSVTFSTRCGSAGQDQEVNIGLVVVLTAGF